MTDETTDQKYPCIAPFLRERLLARDRRRAAAEVERMWFDRRPAHIGRIAWRALSDEKRAAALAALEDDASPTG